MPGDGRNMPRKRKPVPPDDPPKRRQINLSFPGEVAARIDATAEALGLDAPQLLRMIVREHLGEYERRAAKARGETTEGA